jgi:glutathione peroxidase
MNFSRRAVFSLAVLAFGGALLGATTVLDFIPLAIDGKPLPLSSFRGKVLLIVNVASNSIFTPQYAGLEKLYQKYKDQGLVVLAFPSDDFGKEEPGANDAIRQLAQDKYKVTFPMFAKVSLAGEHVAPLFEFLTDRQANKTTGGAIRWNFTKFVVDRDGKVIARFEPDIEPDAPELAVAIEKALHSEKDKDPDKDKAKQEGNRAAIGYRGRLYDILKTSTGHVAPGAPLHGRLRCANSYLLSLHFCS